jgi:hypothetical protein
MECCRESIGLAASLDLIVHYAGIEGREWMLRELLHNNTRFGNLRLKTLERFDGLADRSLIASS